MKPCISIIACLCVSTSLFAQTNDINQQPASAHTGGHDVPVDEMFTYQGELRSSGSTVSGTADFVFRLYNAKFGGAQIRTAEIPDHHEVSGYQADLGTGYWGCLYDESRRKKILAGPPAEIRDLPVRMNDWNSYRIRCEGPRIRIWINDVQTVDFTEADPQIPLKGIIALQIHGNLVNEVHYRNVRLREL